MKKGTGAASVGFLGLRHVIVTAEIYPTPERPNQGGP